MLPSHLVHLHLIIKDMAHDVIYNLDDEPTAPETHLGKRGFLEKEEATQ